MYEDLIKRLRELQAIAKHCDEKLCEECENIKLCDKYDNKKLSRTHKEAADAIEELSKPKWISVTERLPEKEDEAVIVWEKQGFALIDWRHDNKWAILDNNCGIATHWMPLPEPPKEEF